HLRGEDSRVERVMHAFSAEWIDHSGSVTNGDDVTCRSVVCQRSCNKPARLRKVSPDGVFRNEEAKIGAGAFHRYCSAVSVVEKPEIEGGAAGSAFDVLNSEFRDGTSCSKSAQLPGCIDNESRADFLSIRDDNKSIIVLD